MAKVFTYPLTDTVNGVVAIDQMRMQIDESPITAKLEPQPEGVMVGFESVVFMFEADLSNADEAELDTLVAAHDGAGCFQLDTLTVIPKATLFAITYAKEGWMAFVPDEAGGPVPVYYDGADWRTVTTGLVVA